MTVRDQGADKFEGRLTRALEAQPDVRLPEGFAARLAARAPERVAAVGSTERARSSVGFGVALVGAACLLAAIVVLAAMGGVRGNPWLAMGLDVEFAALMVWLTLRPRPEQ